MAQWKKWDPERMKAVIEAMRNKEMGSYKVSRIFSISQTTLERYIRDWEKSSNEAIKTKLCKKQVLRYEAENDLAEHSLLMKRKFLA
jgi:23S rRNA maturation-related 3'-5' exoribonuclease YhaM